MVSCPCPGHRAGEEPVDGEELNQELRKDGTGSRWGRGKGGTHVDVPYDNALSIGVNKSVACGVAADNFGDAPLHLGEAGEHLLCGDTNPAGHVRGGPRLGPPPR